MRWVLAVGLAACGYTALPSRSLSPIPEVTNPAPPHQPYLPLEDRDGDGVYADQCPTEPEDQDGYLDHDGCPDLDNDGDGIPDALDHCPDTAASTSNGCPPALHVDGADLDGDGVARDLCPAAPEDLDGYDDEDGCPDPDNDGDGIPDRDDRCPNAAEDHDSSRGGDPQDGCPR